MPKTKTPEPTTNGFLMHEVTGLVHRSDCGKVPTDTARFVFVPPVVVKKLTKLLTDIDPPRGTIRMCVRCKPGQTV